MKHTFLILFLLISSHGFSQKKLPVIKAASNRAKIYEEGNPVSGWNITPEANPDIFVTNKLTKAKTVKFVTDSDSIIFKIKPGEKKDFIVLLNGKDSCYTRIQSPERKDLSAIRPEIHDSIPLKINKQNTIYVLAVLNKVDTLQLNFDSGTKELVITNEALKSKVKSKLTFYNTPYELQIGHRIYKAPVFDTELSGHDTDGRFGWDLFDGMIVELNYDKGLMIVHSKMPRQVLKDKNYTKLGIHYSNQLFFVESEIEQNGVKNKDLFLFDTGYQMATLLDNDLLRESNFPTDKMDIIKKTMLHGATGNEVPVITAELEKLKIGKYELKNVPAQILTSNKPMSNKNAHYLGNEVLKRFNIVFDFQDNVVYLKPNKYFDTAYTEKKG